MEWVEINVLLLIWNAIFLILCLRTILHLEIEQLRLLIWTFVSNCWNSLSGQQQAGCSNEDEAIPEVHSLLSELTDTHNWRRKDYFGTWFRGFDMITWSHKLGQNIMTVGTSDIRELSPSLLTRNQKAQQKVASNNVSPSNLLLPIWFHLLSLWSHSK